MIIFNAGNRIMNTWVYSVEDGWAMIDTGYEKHYNILLNILLVLSQYIYNLLDKLEDHHLLLDKHNLMDNLYNLNFLYQLCIVLLDISYNYLSPLNYIYF